MRLFINVFMLKVFKYFGHYICMHETGGNLKSLNDLFHL